MPVYLQYGPSTSTTAQTRHLFAADAILHHKHQNPYHPYALADLRGLGLKTDQDYDIAVALTLPRSPANRAAGNFMVELLLAGTGGTSVRGSGAAAITAATRLPPAHARDFLEAGGKRVVFAAARPALLSYTDPLVAQAARLLFLPYHLLAPAAAERDRLVVPMAESLAFDEGDGTRPGSTALPAVLYLEVRSAGPAAEQPLQTYAAEVVFSARLRGLRWFMYQYRLVAFLVLTTAFWLVEVSFMVAVFVVLGLLWGSSDSGSGTGSQNKRQTVDYKQSTALLQPQIKAEEEDTEDDEQKPAIKREEGLDDPLFDRGGGSRGSALAGLSGLSSLPVASASATGGQPPAVGETNEDEEDNAVDRLLGDGDYDDDGNDDEDNDDANDAVEDEEAKEKKDTHEASVVTGRSPSAESPLRQRAPKSGTV